MKTDTDEVSDEVMPKYLSSSIQAFENMIKPILQKTANTIHIESLRQVASLTHQVASIDLDKNAMDYILTFGYRQIKT
jgi:hypothetical protein